MNLDWIIGRCNEVLFGIKNKQAQEVWPSEEELQTLFSQASLHGMLPVVISSFGDVAFPNQEIRRVFIKWYGTSERSKGKYQKRLMLMERMALLFKRAGLDIMFLKGATTALLYPDPQLRVFSDIDYYMFGKSDDSIKVLKAAGIETSEYFNHHTQANCGGILLENHYDFLDRQNHKGNLLLDDELKALAATEGYQYPFEFENKEVDNAYRMSPTMNAIFLMRHMAIHFFSESVALRMLYDWALFLRVYSSVVDWSKAFELYEKAGMADFPRMIQAILVTKLGLTIDCPIEPLEGKTTERVWNSIVEQTTVNPYKKNGIQYLFYELKTFVGNRWKHQLVFKDESYIGLLFGYAWLYLKEKITGRKIL